MSGLDFEYGIKKDIRNNPIVREIDQARQRQLWRSVGLGVLIVAAALFSGYQKLQLLRHGYAMEDLQRELSREAEINRHLRLEVETLRAPRRIADLATRQLHLVEPARDQAIVIERVTASAPAAKSLVASAR
jgi:cell division protein FtsL